MSRILSGGVWGLAVAAIAAFSAVPAVAASTGGAPHIVLVRGGGGGGGGGGGHGFGGGGFSGGGHSFGGEVGGGRSFASPSIAGNTGRTFSGAENRAFSGNSFANGNHSSYYRGNTGYDGYRNGGWNNGNWAWRGGWGWGGYGLGWGWPWLIGYGYGYPGYYYGYDNGPYYDYNNADYYDNSTVPQQVPAQPAQPPQSNQMTADEGQGNQYLDQGIQSFQSGDYKNSMRMAEHAVIDSPRDAEAHELISLSAFALKDYRTAASEAHAVIALGGVPSWDQVYALYQNADSFTSQLRSLEDYVKANPKSAEGQFLLGTMYLTTGYSAEAHDHLVDAAKLTPKDQLAQQLVKGAGGQAPATANRPEAADTK